MSMKALFRVLLPILAVTILVDVWVVFFDVNGGFRTIINQGSDAIFIFFRLAGLTAFTLLGFQIATGPFMKLLEELYGQKFYKVHAIEGVFTLLFALLH